MNVDNKNVQPAGWKVRGLPNSWRFFLRAAINQIVVEQFHLKTKMSTLWLHMFLELSGGANYQTADIPLHNVMPSAWLKLKKYFLAKYNTNINLFLNHSIFSVTNLSVNLRLRLQTKLFFKLGAWRWSVLVEKGHKSFPSIFIDWHRVQSWSQSLLQACLEDRLQ